MIDATETLYYRARYYNPNIGRFVSEDPILNPAFGVGQSKKSPNHTSWAPSAYSYSQNQPILYKDPSGLRKCESGNCPDCPDGHWVYGEGGASLFAMYGKKAGGFLAVCTSRPMICAMEYDCWSVGIGFDISLGGGGGDTPFGNCECAEDLEGKVVSLEGGGGVLAGELGLPTKGKCISGSGTISVGWSAYLKVNVCNIKKKWCVS